MNRSDRLYYIVVLLTSIAIALSNVRLFSINSPVVFSICLASSLLLNAVILLILLGTPFFRTLFVTIWFSLLGVYATILIVYETNPVHLISACLDTTWAEFSGWLHWIYLVLVPLYIAVPVLYVKWMRTIEPQWVKNIEAGFKSRALVRKLSVIAVYGIVLCSFFMGFRYSYYQLFRSDSLEARHPSALFSAFYPASMFFDCSVELVQIFFTEAKFLSSLPRADAFDSTMDDEDEDMIFVFILGETCMAQHASLNGYERPTTPNLDREAASSNLVSFPDTLSYGHMTNESAVGIFTNAEIATQSPSVGNFALFLKKHGYETHYFSSSGEMRNLKILMFGIDKTVWPDAEKLYANIPLNEHPGKSLYIVYTEGSHFPYKERYPAKFSKFQPDDHSIIPQNNTMEVLTNAYDNSLLYTDYELGRLIRKLKDKKAVIFMVGAHGEFLGENGLYGSNEDPSLTGRKPLMFLWVSDIYKQSNPDKIDNLKSWQSTQVSHDHVFHTALGIAKIHFQLYKPELDLTRRKKTENSVQHPMTATSKPADSGREQHN